MDGARQLEVAGFDWITVGDGYDAFVTAAAIATVTRRATIGSCVTLLTRSPVQTVQACSGLDDLSGGRFVLGLGVGPNEWNRDWHGLDPSRPAQRMAEYLQCLRAAWDSQPGRPAHVEGEIFRVRNYVRGRRSPSERLPVLVGVVGPLNTRNAGQYADGAIFDIELPLRYVSDRLMPALLEGARRAGKTRSEVTAAALLALSVDRDSAVAKRRARHAILLHLPVHYYEPVFEWAGFGREAAAAREALLAGDVLGAVEAIPDAMVDALTLAGTPDEVRRALQPWNDLLDLTIFVSPSYQLPPDEAAVAYRNAFDFLANEIVSRGARR
jgi:alkanesulfonate monooxygenase SsuD/methylene tetrahydromethanopterin reductase-like flavin-dependent oxidoreductase (luciferase family)